MKTTAYRVCVCLSLYILSFSVSVSVSVSLSVYLSLLFIVFKRLFSTLSNIYDGGFFAKILTDYYFREKACHQRVLN